MEKIIVKAPKDTTADYDYVAFSFNGYHSYEDLNIWRVSDGKEYKKTILPENKSIVTQHEADHSTICVKQYDTFQRFSIKIAFDDLTEQQFQQLQKVFNGKTVAPLWFSEEPYKVYLAKISEPPKINFLCFDEWDGKKYIRKYKGDSVLNFISYEPYAYSPDEIHYYNTEGNQYEKREGQQNSFINVTNTPEPNSFAIKQDGKDILKIKLNIPEGQIYEDVKWNSEIGLVDGVLVEGEDSENVSSFNSDETTNPGKIINPIPSPDEYKCFNNFGKIEKLLPNVDGGVFQYGECPFPFVASLGTVKNIKESGINFSIKYITEEGSFTVEFSEGSSIPDFLEVIYKCVLNNEYKKIKRIIPKANFVNDCGNYTIDFASPLEQASLIAVRGKKGEHEYIAQAPTLDFTLTIGEGGTITLENEKIDLSTIPVYIKCYDKDKLEWVVLDKIEQLENLVGKQLYFYREAKNFETRIIYFPEFSLEPKEYKSEPVYNIIFSVNWAEDKKLQINLLNLFKENFIKETFQITHNQEIEYEISIQDEEGQTTDGETDKQTGPKEFENTSYLNNYSINDNIISFDPQMQNWKNEKPQAPFGTTDTIVKSESYTITTTFDGCTYEASIGGYSPQPTTSFSKLVKRKEEETKNDETTPKNPNIGKRIPIPYTGQSYGVIQPKEFEVVNIKDIKFNYLYY